MSKVKYIACDICGDKIPRLNAIDITGVARRYLNSCRLRNKMFNGIDICDDCIDKIRYLSLDIKYEQQYMNEIFQNARKYDDPNEEDAYYKGIEDALEVLNHKRLQKIKILKEK